MSVRTQVYDLEVDGGGDEEVVFVWSGENVTHSVTFSTNKKCSVITLDCLFHNDLYNCDLTILTTFHQENSHISIPLICSYIHSKSYYHAHEVWC